MKILKLYQTQSTDSMYTQGLCIEDTDAPFNFTVALPFHYYEDWYIGFRLVKKKGGRL